MSLRSLLLLVPVAAGLLAVPADAKDKHWKNRGRGYDGYYGQDRYGYGGYGNDRYGYRSGYGYDRYGYDRYGYDDRRTRRRGMDRDRDGAIERWEWRGNNRSFSRQDRDRDGVITQRDRAIRRHERRNGYYNGYGYPDRYYGRDRYGYWR